MALDHSTSRKLKPPGVLLSLSRFHTARTNTTYLPYVFVRAPYRVVSIPRPCRLITTLWETRGLRGDFHTNRAVGHDKQQTPEWPRLAGWLNLTNCLTPVCQQVNMVLDVHRNHEAYWGLGERGREGVWGVGEEGDYIPIATLSPPE